MSLKAMLVYYHSSSTSSIRLHHQPHSLSILPALLRSSRTLPSGAGEGGRRLRLGALLLGGRYTRRRRTGIRSVADTTTITGVDLLSRSRSRLSRAWCLPGRCPRPSCCLVVSSGTYTSCCTNAWESHWPDRRTGVRSRLTGRGAWLGYRLTSPSSSRSSGTHETWDASRWLLGCCNLVGAAGSCFGGRRRWSRAFCLWRGLCTGLYVVGRRADIRACISSRHLHVWLLLTCRDVAGHVAHQSV